MTSGGRLIALDGERRRKRDAASLADARAPRKWNSEQDIVEQARAGDLAAFEELIRSHADRTLAFLTRWLGDREEAEDVFQEATIRAFVHLHHLRRGAPFRPWFFRVAINRAKSQVSARERRRQQALTVAETPQLSSSSPSAELRTEAAQVLERALAEVSMGDRQILLLRFAEELTMAEISEVLGVPQVVVKMRVSRARKRFRRAVQRAEEEGWIE